MRAAGPSGSMRAPLLLVVALLAAGCTGALGGERRVEGDCGPSPAQAAVPARGSPVWFYALHDAGQRDVVFCVQVNDGPVHRQEMPGASIVPNVKRLQDEDRADGSLKVAAWMAGDKIQVTRIFPATEENHVVLRLSREDGLQIEKHERQPMFA